MTDFKWRHFQGDVILWAVRWYCRYPISYRDLEEMLAERGISVDHTTIYRWVQCYAPEMEKRLRWFWRRGFDPSWRLDETYVKVRGKWTYLYRAVDKRGRFALARLAKGEDDQGQKSGDDKQGEGVLQDHGRFLSAEISRTVLIVSVGCAHPRRARLGLTPGK
ncbi:IS6 family transposase [Corynebacterium tuberculostearicum]|uniref:IS6 family transposase n=1 Tax=Corynebacterium tuberculostearicum TaxID=38304 RepID=UPI0038CF8564